jgi:hypothetical protein
MLRVRTPVHVRFCRAFFPYPAGKGIKKGKRILSVSKDPAPGILTGAGLPSPATRSPGADPALSVLPHPDVDLPERDLYLFFPEPPDDLPVHPVLDIPFVIVILCPEEELAVDR